MWRFVLRENIRRFETLIPTARSDSERDKLRQLLDDAREELDELEQASTPAVVQRDLAFRFFAEHSVEEAVRLHAAQFGTLQIYDESRERLIVIAQKNFRAPFLYHLSQVKPGDGSACGRCLADGAPVAVEDVCRDAEFEPHRKAALEAGFEAVQASPVPSRAEALIAVLSTYFSAPRRFTPQQLDGMATYAARLGPTLERHLAA